MLRLSLLFLLLFLTRISSGQNSQLTPNTFNCLSQKTFRTDSLGNNKEKLPFPLTFIFKEDSLIVGNSLNLHREFMSFRIEKKDSCQWNKDFTVGKTSYQLLMVDKQQTKRPKLNIIYEPSGKKYIEILYENSEERIFTIVQQRQSTISNPKTKE